MVVGYQKIIKIMEKVLDKISIKVNNVILTDYSSGGSL
jgi:hypothetical protein